ncbi:MAG: TolC family protein [Desulfatitalea sp.]|nr:TolC family protein [Desulfatitalea sp.]NNK00948.1 TolC family protein [Desulfatitalea sp.]
MRAWAIGVLILAVFVADPALAGKQVSIGMVIDDHTRDSQAFIHSLQAELTRLLGSKYRVHIAEKDVLSAKWSAERAKRLYHQLVRDPRITIIIGGGVITTTMLAAEKSYPKPVITLGVIDPAIQGVAPVQGNRSGIPNFTYVLFNRSLQNDLSQFHQIIAFDKVAVIADPELIKLALNNTRELRLGDGGQTVTLMPLPMSGSKEAVATQAEAAQAAYISYLGRLSLQQRQELIRTLTERGIPTFGLSVKDAQIGAMAAAAPEENWISLVRRLALNIEAILGGRNASTLGVRIDLAESLTINMKTAELLGISPPFSILSQATLLHEFDVPGAPATTLVEVMRAASRSSLDVRIEQDSVDIAQEDVSLAKSEWRPSLNASGSYTLIDEETANASFGSQVQRTTAGALTAQQLIYSDDVAGNITASKHLLLSAQSTLAQVRLDSILTTAKAYLNILKAKTAVTIHQQNVMLTQQNLAIAQKREIIGYSGQSDVYRWQSKLAGAQTDLFAAKNSYRLTKLELNRTLNRPLKKPFRVKELSLSDQFSDHGPIKQIRALVKTRLSLETFTQFLMDEALRNAPEIDQFDAAVAAQQRQLLSYQRKRYLPVVSLNGQGQHIFSRDGVGASLPGVEPIDDNWNATLNLSWSLLQGGANNSNVRKTQSAITRLKNQKQRLVSLIRINVRASLMDLANSSVNQENSKRASKFAAKSLSLVTQAYEKGKVSVVELVDAQNSALNAELAALNSEYDFVINQMDLERRIGHFSLLKSAGDNQAFLDRLDSFFKQSSN